MVIKTVINSNIKYVYLLQMYTFEQSIILFSNIYILEQFFKVQERNIIFSNDRVENLFYYGLQLCP